MQPNNNNNNNNKPSVHCAMCKAKCTMKNAESQCAMAGKLRKVKSCCTSAF